MRVTAEKKDKVWSEDERQYLLDNYKLIRTNELAQRFSVTPNAISQQYHRLFKDKEGQELKAEIAARNAVRFDTINRTNSTKGWKYLTEKEQLEIVSECATCSITSVALKHRIANKRVKLILEKYGAPIRDMGNGRVPKPKAKHTLKPVHADMLNAMQGKRYYWMGTARIVRGYELMKETKTVHVYTIVGDGPQSYERVVKIPVKRIGKELGEFKRI